MKNITFGVIGRGTVIDHKDGTLTFQDKDILLVKGLAKKFVKVVYAPFCINQENQRYQFVKGIYKGEINDKTENIEVFKLYLKDEKGSFRDLKKRKNQFISIINIKKFIKKVDFVLIFWPSPISFLSFILCNIYSKRYAFYKGSSWKGENPSTGKVRRKSVKTIAGGLIEDFVLLSSPLVFVRGSTMGEKKFIYLRGNSFFKKEHLYQRADTCNSKKIILLSVAHLTPQKRVEDILKSIKILIDKGYDIVFEHIGASLPENLGKITKLTEKLDIRDRVNFNGHIGNLDQLIKFYQKADIFVLASLMEGFPRVIVEAMSQSLPVVASSTEGIKSFFTHGEELFMFEPGNVNNIVNNVEVIINNTDFRKKIIRKGFEFAKWELSLPNPEDSIVNRIKNLFDE